jgi:hypothetical protein
MIDFKTISPTFPQREKELFEFLEIPLRNTESKNMFFDA